MQASAERVFERIETLDKHAASTTSESTQLYESLRRWASEWMASLTALEQSTASVLDDNSKMAEADGDRITLCVWHCGFIIHE